MAAPEGNQFWKLRSKHGRDKLFADPILMWEAACEYFEWATNHPFKQQKTHVVSKGDFVSAVEKVDLDVPRPFTMAALCLYLCANTHYFSDFKDGLKGKTDELSKGFSDVIREIENTIYTQKFEGASSGFFNANLISRDLGLADKREVESKVTEEKKINISVDGKDIDLSK